MSALRARHRPASQQGVAGVAAAALVAAALAALLALALGGTFGGKGLLAVAGVAGVAGASYAFFKVPHVMAAISIVVFATQPAVKLFVSPATGPVKDLLAIAACLAALAAVRTRPDGRTRHLDAWLVSGTLLLLVLYLVNPAGGHDSGWFFGMRLVTEPFGLLLAGYALPNPGRTWRWALGALLAVGAVNVLYGLAQQVLGVNRLTSLGYTYGEQVRQTSTGQLRSFGTMEEPFSYALLLLLGLAAVAMRRPPRAAMTLLGAFLLLGVGTSVVRTAALTLAALGAITLVRAKRLESAAALVAAVVVAAAAAFVLAPGATGNKGSVTDFLFTLNGRTTVWTNLVDSPSNWLAGKGVGVVGGGASRSQAGGIFTPGAAGSAVAVQTQSQANRFSIDSTYLSTLADVGLVGLALLLAILGRAVWLALAAARRGSDAGWTALALLVVAAIDASTHPSLTSFPDGFIVMLLVGSALAAAQTEIADEPDAARSATPEPAREPHAALVPAGG